ncbi:MAG: hypothetical protein ACTSP3_12285, partial [Candidatus Heimdallarchaeaceae archaeon]
MTGSFIIFIDILGFYASGIDVSEEFGISPEVFRKRLLEVVQDCITKLKDGGLISIYTKNGDSWLILINETQMREISLQLFFVINSLLNIKTGFENLPIIQLELCVGYVMNNLESLKEENLISNNEIISFLKTNITERYRNTYKKKYRKSIKNSFVLFTQDAFSQLESFDKNNCFDTSFNSEFEISDYFIARIDQIKERSLVFTFLEKIGRQYSSIYNRIDSVFIEPIEFKDIQKTLEDKHIVFITGTPEYGKTYCAVRLLWLYFKKGYNPIWFEGEEKTQRINVRKKLIEIDSFLKENNVIYYEDPFGKIIYEKRENLEREIGLIIDKIKNRSNVYVIISSREEVFKNFEQEKLTSLDIKIFEEKLNIKKPSYNLEKRVEMLLKWAEAQECAWLNNEKTVKSIIAELKNKLLISPLSIYAFTISTRNILEPNLISDEIKAKSEETSMNFAKEIEQMDLSKSLFLSLLFINEFDISFLSKQYEILIKKFNIKEAFNFNYIINWFKDDKIIMKQQKVSFSHPSYNEALKFLLVKNKEFTNYNVNFFSHILLHLSSYQEASNAVAKLILENFNMFDYKIRNQILIELSLQQKSSWTIAKTLIYNYDLIGSEVSNNLIMKLLERKNIHLMIMILFHIYGRSMNNKICRKIRLVIMTKSELELEIGWIVAETFENQTERLKNELLIDISEEDIFSNLLNTLVLNYQELSEDLRRRLLEALWKLDIFKVELIEIIMEYYTNLPQDLKDFIFQIPEDKSASLGMVEIITEKYYTLPRIDREKILAQLKNKKKIISIIIETLVNSYNLMTENSRRFLFLLLDNNYLSKYELNNLEIN